MQAALAGRACDPAACGSAREHSGYDASTKRGVDVEELDEAVAAIATDHGVGPFRRSADASERAAWNTVDLLLPGATDGEKHD